MKRINTLVLATLTAVVTLAVPAVADGSHHPLPQAASTDQPEGLPKEESGGWSKGSRGVPSTCGKPGGNKRSQASFIGCDKSSTQVLPKIGVPIAPVKGAMSKLDAAGPQLEVTAVRETLR